MTNLYYNTIKMLLERVSTVMVDQVALEALMGLVEGAMNGNPSILDVLNLTSDIATEKGLKLLFVSCAVCYQIWVTVTSSSFFCKQQQFQNLICTAVNFK